MSGGKKFNIWIAYSDLFTNLSTFLFIAALGVFASLGSKNLTKDGAVAYCTIPPAVERRLTSTHLLTPIGQPFRVGSSCRRYYKIDGYRFHSRLATLTQFYAGDHAMSQIEARTQVCMPIWVAIGLQQFEDRQGRVLFHGIGSADNGWKSGQPVCASKLAKPKSNMLGYPDPLIAAQKVEQCYTALDANAAKPDWTFCRKVRTCREETADGKNPAATPWCRQMFVVRAWRGAETSDCLRETALAQASVLTGTCEPMYSTPPEQRANIPDNGFMDSDMSQIARYDVTRPALWRRVGASGFAKGAPVNAALDDEAQAILSPLPAGTVVVEVRLGAD